MISEYDDHASSSGAGDALDMSAPLSERVIDKNFRMRIASLPELIALLENAGIDGDDSIFARYCGLMEKIAADSNPKALDIALQCILTFVDRCPDISLRGVSSSIDVLITKVFPSRQRDRAFEILDKFIERESTVKDVINSVYAAFSHKLPKVRPVAIQFMQQTVTFWGISHGKFDMKPIVGSLSSLLEATDSAIRDAALDLAVACARWMGVSPIKNALSGIRTAQMDVFDQKIESFANEALSRTKFFRTEVPAVSGSRVSSDGLSSISTSECAEEVPEIDPLEFASEVTLDNLCSDSFLARLNEKKWSDKKEALDEFLEKTTAVRLVDHSGASTVLRKEFVRLLNDSHFLVVSGAATAIKNLSEGLREGFSREARLCLSGLLDKLKEKKQAIVESIRASVLSLFFSGALNIFEQLEDFQAALSHKTPKVHFEAASVLCSIIQSKHFSRKTPNFSIRPLVNILLTASDDTQGDTRDKACEALGSLIQKLGSRDIIPLLKNLDKNKLSKIESFSGVSTSNSSSSSVSLLPERDTTSSMRSEAKPIRNEVQAIPSVVQDDKSMPPPPSRGRESSTRDAAVSNRERSRSSSRPKTAPSSSRASSSLPGSGKSTQKASSVSSISTVRTVSDLEDDSEAAYPGPIYCMEESIEFLSSEMLIPRSALETINGALSSSGWKERLEEGLIKFRELLENDSEFERRLAVGDDTSEKIAASVLCFLCQQDGFSEKNMVVSSEKLNFLQGIILSKWNSASAFPRRCIRKCIPALLERIHEAKLRETSSECILSLAGFTAPRFIFSMWQTVLHNSKNPKLSSELLVLMNRALLEFGPAHFNIPALVVELKELLEHKNPSVKSSCNDVIATLARALGEGVLTFFSDVKPAQLSVIEKAVHAALELGSLPPPTRFVFGKISDVTSHSSSSSSSSSSSAMPVLSLDDMLPRVDISAQLSSSLLQKLNDANWKERKAALEEIDSILNSANKRVTGQLLDLASALKTRLSDANISITNQTLSVVGNLIESLGKEFDKYYKQIVPGLLGKLGDPKAVVRSQAICAARLAAQNVSSDKMMGALSRLLSKADSPSSKLELAKFLFEMYGSNFSSEDTSILHSLVAPVVDLLSDRSADLRTVGRQLMIPLLVAVGEDPVLRRIRDLKPAEQKALKPVIASCIDEVKSSFDGMSTSGKASTLQNIASGKISEKESGVIASSFDENEKENRPSTAPSSFASANRSRRVPKESKSALGSTGSHSSLNPSSSHHGSQTSSSDVDLSTALPLISNEGKDPRMQRERKLKWAFDECRQEFIDILSEQMNQCFSPSFLPKLKSGDFNDHLFILQRLFDTSAEQRMELLQSLDVVLKWLSLRIMDGNPRVLLRSSEYLERIFELLTASEYQLSEYESYVFLPFLIEKMGNSNQNIRAALRGVLETSFHVCAPNRLFVFLIRGLESKNSKTRSDCLLELVHLLKAFPLDQLVSAKGPGAAVSRITTFLGDKDHNVRSGVLDFCEEVYRQLGEELFALLSKSMPEPHREMIEQRISHSSIVVTSEIPTSALSETLAEISTTDNTAVPKITPISSHDHLMISIPPEVQYSLDLQNLGLSASSGENTPRSDSSEMSSARSYDDHISDKNSSYQRSSAPLRRVQFDNYVPSTSSSHSVCVGFEAPTPFLSVSTSSRIPQSAREAIDSTEHLSAELKKHSTSMSLTELLTILRVDEPVLEKDIGMDDFNALLRDEEILISRIDEVVHVLMHQLLLGIQSCATHLDDRFSGNVREALNTHLKKKLSFLLKLFSRRPVLGAMSRIGVKVALRYVLSCMLTSGLDRLADDLLHPGRALNNLSQRLLGNTDRNICLESLIDLLRDTIEGNDIPRENEKDGSNSSIKGKMEEIVCKCIMKLVRTWGSNTYQLDLDRMVLSVCGFWADYGVRGIQEKADASSGVLCTMKTCLEKLIELDPAQVRRIVQQHPDILYERTSDSLDKREYSVVAQFVFKMCKQFDLPDSNISAVGNTTEVTVCTSHKEGVTHSSVAKAPSENTEEFSHQQSSPASFDSLLESIFQDIGCKAKTKEGMNRLFEFLQNYSDQKDLAEPFIARCSGPFQSYIRRSLDRIASERAAAPSEPVPLHSHADKHPIAPSSSVSSPSSSHSSSSGVRMESMRERLRRLGSAPVVTSNVLPMVEDSSIADAPAPVAVHSSASTFEFANTNTSNNSVLSLKERLARLRANSGTL